MCNHIFYYPEDKKENYNPDGKTLIGICKYCGCKKNAYGMRWIIPIEEELKGNPYEKSQYMLTK